VIGIKTLQLRNWRNHTDTAIDLAPITVIVGANGAGKSSIGAAVEYILTGRCQWTDGAGRGANVLITDGAKEAKVAAAVEGIEGLGTIVRTIPGGVQVDEWTGNSQFQSQTLGSMLPDAEVMACCLNSGRFLGLSPKEQQDLLLKFAGAVTSDSVVSALEAWAKGKAVDFGRLNAVLAPHLAAARAEALLDDLDQAVRDARRLAKKEDQQLTAQLQRKPTPAGLPEGATVEALEEQMAELTKRRDELNVAAGKREGQRSRRTEVERKISALDGELAKITVPEESADAIRVALVESSEALTKATEANQRHGIELRQLRERIDTDERIVVKVRGASVCPLANIPCKAKDDVLPGLEASIKERRATLKELEAQTPKLSLEVGRVTAERDRWLAAQTAANTAERLTAQLNEYREEAATYAKLFGEDDAAEAKELADTVERIAKGKAMIAAAQAEEREREQYQQLVAKAEALRADVVALELLVEAFGKDGIKPELLKATVAPFEGFVNEYLSIMADPDDAQPLKASADLNDGLDIWVQTKRGFLPARALSKSERLRLGVAIQLALSKLSDFGVVVIDDTESLTPDNRLRLIDLMQRTDAYCTAIILSVRGDVDPVDPGVQGLAVWTIEDGVLTPAPAPEPEPEEDED
jgi:DNA repair exonuclease SbcCD ATPase subunit